jgi:hypothetical protein
VADKARAASQQTDEPERVKRPSEITSENPVHVSRFERPIVDKDGEPVLDKDGNPKTEKAVKFGWQSYFFTGDDNEHQHDGGYVEVALPDDGPLDKIAEKARARAEPEIKKTLRDRRQAHDPEIARLLGRA